MTIFLDPIQFVLIALAGWMNERQLQTIEYLREENRVLREQLGDRRVRFNDDQRRRLATKARGLGLPTFCHQKNRETSGDKGWRKGLRPTLNALRSRDSQQTQRPMASVNGSIAQFRKSSTASHFARSCT